MIERHDIGTIGRMTSSETYSSALETLQRIFKKEITPYLLRSIYELNIELALYELFLNKDEAKCWERLTGAMQACKAIYRLAHNVGKEVEIELEGLAPFTLTGLVKHDFITPWEYIRHLILALLLRDREACAMLSGLAESIMNPEEAGLSAAPFNVPRFILFRELLEEETTKEAIVEKIDIAYCEYLKHYGPEEEKTMSHIRFELLFLKYLLDNDLNGMNKTVEERLLTFKAYYGEEDASNCKGFYDLYTTGLAAFAYDQGLEITVESDYLPRFLIEGRYAKEQVRWPLV